MVIQIFPPINSIHRILEEKGNIYNHLRKQLNDIYQLLCIDYFGGDLGHQRETWDTSWGDMGRVDQLRNHRLTICI